MPKFTSHGWECFTCHVAYPNITEAAACEKRHGIVSEEVKKSLRT
jgi:hypothetical protein